MPKKTRPKVIFFNLDNTLYDHHHSLECAMAAARHTIPISDTYSTKELMRGYYETFWKIYNLSLDDVTTDSDQVRVAYAYWFSSIGFKDHSLEDLQAFRAAYRKAYKSSQRVTPGTVETLTELIQRGYKIVVITNGEFYHQRKKLVRIGIAHMIDTLLTARDLGCCKPDRRIFRRSMASMGIEPEMLGGESRTYMIGDNIEFDIKPALDAGLNVIVYSPACAARVPEPYRTSLPVIHDDMTQLLTIMKEDDGLEDDRDEDRHEYPCPLFSCVPS